MKYIPRLKKKYNEEIVNNLKANYKSVMQVQISQDLPNQGVGSSHR